MPADPPQNAADADLTTASTADLTNRVHDAVVVGAGPAGIGVAALLAQIGVTATVLERDDVGASFRHWPPETRLLTPSFTGNQFRVVDLNAVTADTSPALSLGEEHPTGPDYARYLEMVVKHEDLTVYAGIDVTGIAGTTTNDSAVLTVSTNIGEIQARNVVWAAGEAAYPRRDGFDGAEHCVPIIDIHDWDDHPGETIAIVGGYESGIDAAVQLVAKGRQVTVLDEGAPWEVVDADPSLMLSPYTQTRLRVALDTGRLQLLDNARVTDVRHDAEGWQVTTEQGTVDVDAAPLLATGFDGSLTTIPNCFESDEDGRVIVTEEADESTRIEGLFLAGPMLSHRGAIFCFIYKFRQRFAIVANAVGERLGVDTSALKSLRDYGFYLDDLACCDDACEC